MIAAFPYDGAIKVLLVLILATAALVISQRTLSSLFNVYAGQSFLLALVALAIYWREGGTALLAIAGLTVASKVVVIPWVMRRVQKNIKVKRDLEFRYLTPVRATIVSVGLIFVVYESFSRFLADLSGDPLLLLGAVIGVSLALMGMLVVFSRKKVVTKIIGYLTMENGVLLFSLFIADLPFIIEVLIMLDLMMLILLSTVLAFGIDSTVEDFHQRLHISGLWPRNGKK